MKQRIQIVFGTVCLAIGMAMFIYFGTRERPGFENIEQELQQRALVHDIATAAGVLLLFSGLVILILGAVSRWNKQHSETDEQSRM